ncbi:MAG: hypothetical protein ACXVFN_19400 [Solirubrobacteraceae bacterium]
MRERFDAGTGLVAVGAVLLLVSLFIDWYKPGGDAWVVFEWLDLALAGAAVASLLALAPRFPALGRAVPVIAVCAFIVVGVQLISPPPVARGAHLESGAWLALGATALMALGAALAAASISVTVDVRERERRRRTAAIDARERIFDEPLEASDPADLERTSVAARAAARRAGRREQVSAPAERMPEAPAAAEPVPIPEPPDDPQRTQAMEPVDRTDAS